MTAKDARELAKKIGEMLVEQDDTALLGYPYEDDTERWVIGWDGGINLDDLAAKILEWVNA